MKVKRWIKVVLVSFLLIFIFKNVLLRLATKGWEKELLAFETNEYRVEMAVNKEKGCATRKTEFLKDTILITNQKLDNILLTLTQKNINTSRFSGLYSKNEGYNFSYYSKDSTKSCTNHCIEIMDTLSLEFNFNYSYDTIEEGIYSAEIIDNGKLRKHLVTDAKGRVTWGNGNIKFHGNSLEGIIDFFGHRFKGMIVKSSIKDSSYYAFTIPSTNKKEIISFLNNELGIKLSEQKEPVEFLTVRFKE